ncbi:MAG: fructosamine kinase family protein [Mariprofundales bacterium]|nr:fructosamine kinase family protein [Mariprofundales bacterium]
MFSQIRRTNIWTVVASEVSKASGHPFTIRQRVKLSGGSINAAFRIDDGEQSFLVKLNHQNQLTMFEAEREGLALLRSVGASVRIPAVVCCGSAQDRSWLVLEYIPLRPSTDGTAEVLGSAMATIHRQTDDRYGWSRDNTIGVTPQMNAQGDSWRDFFRDHRLGEQLRLAENNHLDMALLRKGEFVLNACNALLAGHQPPASLLHGDLWSGNQAADQRGAPVVFDPAVYYGDRECDLAMTRLFGGIPDAFLRAYHDLYPIDSGFERRMPLYNLYHLLNHANMFGGGYVRQAEKTMDRLLMAL